MNSEYLSPARQKYDYTKHFEYSKAQLLAQQPEHIKKAFYDSLSSEDKLNLMYDPNFLARPKQIIPPYNPKKPHTLFVCGRFYGKSRVGSWHVTKWARENPRARIAIVGATAGEIRKVIVKGESGILENSHPNFMPVYVANTQSLTWPNGAQATLVSAETPEALRGQQFTHVYADEVFKWPYQELVFEQLQFCLRLGNELEMLFTSTPRPTQLAKKLMNHHQWNLITGCSYENSALSELVYETLVDEYHNTTFGRQEIFAEILDDNVHALFKREDIDKARLDKSDFDYSKLTKIVVGVDPAITEGKKSDATGIVVCGRDDAGQGYVLEDLTIKGSPNTWASKAIYAAEKWGANYIRAESNQGGQMVENTIKNLKPTQKVELEWSSRSKELRAAPVAALYEQGRVSHIGAFTFMEDQMCNFDPSLGKNQKSPDALDAAVHALTDLVVTTKKKAWIL